MVPGREAEDGDKAFDTHILLCSLSKATSDRLDYDRLKVTNLLRQPTYHMLNKQVRRRFGWELLQESRRQNVSREATTSKARPTSTAGPCEVWSFYIEATIEKRATFFKRSSEEQHAAED